LLLRKALFPAGGTHLSIPLDATSTLLVSLPAPEQQKPALRDYGPVNRIGCTYYSAGSPATAVPQSMYLEAH